MVNMYMLQEFLNGFYVPNFCFWIANMIIHVVLDVELKVVKFISSLTKSGRNFNCSKVCMHLQPTMLSVISFYVATIQLNFNLTSA